jgi:predicted amidophosphoribosyltransferase
MQFINNFLDLAMPQSCAGCGERSELMASRSRVVCARCTKNLLGSAHEVRVKGVSSSEFPIVAAAFYEGSARNILLAAKERGLVALIPLIADSASVAISSLLIGCDPSDPLALVPVPSMAKNLRSRGYNLVAQMADLIAGDLQMRFDDLKVIPVLRHSRRVSDQSRLTAKERALNLSGAFSIVAHHAASLDNRQIIIVDDLVTTGSTLIEARRALIAVGARLRGAACALNSH